MYTIQENERKLDAVKGMIRKKKEEE